MKSPSPIVAILHNIRSLHNVGSMFRSADGVGIHKIYLSGYTPLPIDAFGKPVKEIAKTALGAEKTIPWQHVASLPVLIKKLQKEGYTVVGLECGVGATDYRHVHNKGPIALLVGNEVRGLSGSALKHVDVVAQIPMRGKKESLNVGVAFAVFLYRLTEGVLDPERLI